MAEEKPKAGQPQAKPAAAPLDKKALASAAQREIMNDPALAKYHALLVQNDDKRVLESSLLTSLLVFIVLTFVVFPEFASALLQTEKKDDVIEIPKQTIIKQEQKQEQKQEVKRTQQQRRNEFSSVPDISRPSGEQIVEDIPIDKLNVQTADVDDTFFGGAPDNTPGPIEVAGDVVKPEVKFPPTQPFPQKAKILRRAGKVKVRLIIRKNGAYEVVKILEENPPDFGFGDACLEYLKGSTWQPATQNGRPIDVYYELTILFALRT